MGPCRPIKHYIQKHTLVLRELTHVIVQPLPSTTEGKYHSSLQDIQEWGPGELQASQPYRSHWKVIEHLILENTSRDDKTKKVIRNNQHCFTKGKSRLTNLVNFYDEMSGLVQWQALDSSVQERHACKGESPANGPKNDEGTDAPLLWRKAEKLELFSLEKTRFRGIL